MRIPAFCDNCGAVFPSGFSVSDSTNVSFSGSKSGPCPVCASMGHVPDGVFNVIGDSLQILSAPQRTVAELSLLSQIAMDARSKQAEPEEVANTIRRDLPQFSALASILPNTRTELYAFLALIVAIITLLTAHPQDAAVPQVTVNQVVNQTFIDTTSAAQSAPPRAQPRPDHRGPQ